MDLVRQSEGPTPFKGSMLVIGQVSPSYSFFRLGNKKNFVKTRGRHSSSVSEEEVVAMPS